MIFSSPRIPIVSYVAIGAPVISYTVPGGTNKLLKMIGLCTVPGQFIQIHDTAAAPGALAVPIITYQVPAGFGQKLEFDFSDVEGLNFINGITFASSSTSYTYTASAAPTFSGAIFYIPL